MMTLKRSLLIGLVVQFTLLGGVPGPRSAAAKTTRGGATPPRLSFIDGEVSFWRQGAEDWSGAQINTALAAGDALYAGDGGNLEIQVGPRAFIRAGAASEIDLTTLDPDFLQFRVPGGHAAFDIKRVPRGQTIEIDTPNAAITIDRPGSYRLDVEDNRTVFDSRRGGAAIVVSAIGGTTDVVDNQQIVLEGTDTVQISVNAAPELDAWDHWNDERTAQFAEAPRSAQYVPQEVAGVDDLDRYGDWRDEPRYGHVWIPRDTPADWAPYSAGRWVYDPVYEWTWVDDSPWGWAPYHYGRWVNYDGGWGWAPGPIAVAPVYSPALVAFFGAPGIGVSVGVGLPFVSWCALGFGEPIIPWWGGHGFAGQPYWGGWGGPRIVNNVEINNTRIVNVTNITNYQNVNVRNAVVAVNRDQFGRGRMDHVRLDAQRVQRLQPLRGDLRVRPVAASLVPREARGQRPPERLQTRQVVATRRPQDSTSRLRARGLPTTAAVAVNRPAPRIVQPQRGAAAAAGARPQGRMGVGGAGVAGQPQVPGQINPAEVGHGRPQRPGQPGRIGSPDAATRAMPPPIPRGRPRPGESVGGGRPEPPRPPAGSAARPSRLERSARPQAPVSEQPARNVPPGREGRSRLERSAPPQPPAASRIAPQERSRGNAAPPREAPARAERPARVAPPQRAVPEQPARSAPPPREAPARMERPARMQPPPQRVIPQQPARSAPPPREAPARMERPARMQPPPQQRAVPQQPARSAPPPREAAPARMERPARPQPQQRAVPQQPAHGRAPAGDRQAPKNER